SIRRSKVYLAEAIQTNRFISTTPSTPPTHVSRWQGRYEVTCTSSASTGTTTAAAITDTLLHSTGMGNRWRLHSSMESRGFSPRSGEPERELKPPRCEKLAAYCRGGL